MKKNSFCFIALFLSIALSPTFYNCVTTTASLHELTDEITFIPDTRLNNSFVGTGSTVGVFNGPKADYLNKVKIVYLLGNDRDFDNRRFEILDNRLSLRSGNSLGTGQYIVSVSWRYIGDDPWVHFTQTENLNQLGIYPNRGPETDELWTRVCTKQFTITVGGGSSTPPTTVGSESPMPSTLAQTQIHIVGTDGDDAVYWLNGRRTVLPTTSSYRGLKGASAIAVSGSNVYIVGRDGYDAVYWLNGRRTVLPKSGHSAAARAIAVSGSDVYIAGVEYSSNGQQMAVYWLNGQRTVLPNSNGASASAIAVLGSDVYIADGGVSESGAGYWLNGRRIVLQGLKGADAIAVSGSNVYIVGNDGVDAGYWLNGRLTVLPKENRVSWLRADAIAVSGSNVYIAGSDGWYDHDTDEDISFLVYWLNGRRTVLPTTSRYRGTAWANAIAVSGSDVYVVGHDGNDAVYWLNGQRTVLPKSGNNASASAIAVSGN